MTRHRGNVQNTLALMRQHSGEPCSKIVPLHPNKKTKRDLTHRVRLGKNTEKPQKYGDILPFQTYR
ncbi:MAG: hypothetical protein ACR2OT_05930 [Parvibaculales bacterium]